MTFVIVKEKATGEYSYWPEEKKKELPTDFEVVTTEKTKDTEQAALDRIQQLNETERSRSAPK
jgi:hypothetical protein